MKSFEQRRQILLRQMLFHTCIGHPAASWLSRLGLSAAAEWVHYITLPKRTRRRRSRDSVRFQHDPRLRSMDSLWVPLASIPAAFGRYSLAARVWAFGPVEDALALGACSYAQHPCLCLCGCGNYTYSKVLLCWGCDRDGHKGMNADQLARVADKRRRIKEIENEQ